jgi:hypothetical protein
MRGDSINGTSYDWRSGPSSTTVTTRCIASISAERLPLVLALDHRQVAFICISSSTTLSMSPSLPHPDISTFAINHLSLCRRSLSYLSPVILRAPPGRSLVEIAPIEIEFPGERIHSDFTLIQFSPNTLPALSSRQTL